MRILQPCLIATAMAAALSAPCSSEAASKPTPDYAVGPQYDSTHVYVAPGDFDRLVTSLLVTFGGKASKQGVVTVTPTPSQTMSQLVLTRVGSISVFGFKTPIPYPFGAERTGYLVKDIDAAIKAAQAQGGDLVVATFPDPIGRNAVVQWPGGVNMQFYWHTTPPAYAPLKTIPENRIYVSPDRVDAFVRDFSAFAHGRVTSDDTRAAGAEIGRPGARIRRLCLESGYGKLTIFVTDGHLPWPYGRELTGYEVTDLDDTLGKAKAAGATVIVEPHPLDGRRSAMVQFPGGYIAEIHARVGSISSPQ